MCDPEISLRKKGVNLGVREDSGKMIIILKINLSIFTSKNGIASLRYRLYKLGNSLPIVRLARFCLFC